MVIENRVAFGNFKPGDTLTVPDGAVYDTAHWVEVTSTDSIPDGGVN